MTVPSEETPVYAHSPSRLGAFIRRNPIALKELRGRMRGSRAFMVLTVYVTLMSLFTAVLYMIYSLSSSISYSTTGGVIEVTVSEGLDLGDALSVALAMPVAAVEGISIGESASGSLSISAQLSEGLTLGEAIQVAAAFLVSLTEGVSFGDIMTDATQLPEGGVSITITAGQPGISITLNVPGIAITANQPEIDVEVSPS